MSYGSASAGMASVNASAVKAMSAPPATSSMSVMKAQAFEAAVVAAPLTGLVLAAKGGELRPALMAGGEAALAHYLASLMAGSEYGVAKNGFFASADGKEMEVAGLTGGLLGAWVYWRATGEADALNRALKSAILAGAASFVGSKYLLPMVNKWSSSA
jgi:hypothetical protein